MKPFSKEKRGKYLHGVGRMFLLSTAFWAFIFFQADIAQAATANVVDGVQAVYPSPSDGANGGNTDCKNKLGADWSTFGYDGPSDITFCKHFLTVGYAPGPDSRTALDNVQLMETSSNDSAFCQNKLGSGWQGFGWNGLSNIAYCKHYLTAPLGLVASPSTGTIQVRATLNGSPWPSSGTGSITAAPTFNGVSYPPASFTVPSESVQSVGTWGAAYISGGPPGTTLSSITPSATQTLSANNTITFTFNFTTTTSSTGTIKVRATLNGSPWPSSGTDSSIIIDATTPAGLFPNTQITVPSESVQSFGTWGAAYISGGPPGATLSSITPSASQTLSANGTITFTFNFTSTLPPPPPPNRLPIGSHDSTDNASCYTYGWATDPDNTSIPLSVRLYSSDDPSVRGSLVKTISANQYRGDLTVVCSGSGGSCSFSTSLSGLITTGAQHFITATALDAQTGEEVKLPHTPKSITCATVVTPLPDLIISAGPSLNSGTLVAGNTLTFKATVKNQGNAIASGIFNNRFRVDTDNDGVIDASDPDIQALNSASNLAAGASQQVISPGWTAVAGTYRLYACADRPGNLIPESDENNNCAWGNTITVANASVPTLEVVPSSATVDVGGTQQFGAIYDPDGPTGPLPPVGVTVSALWSSSDNSIATVDALGKATGRQGSFAPIQIIAKYSNLTAFANLTVTASIPTFVVSPHSASVAIGDFKQFTAMYDPDGSGPKPSQNVTATAVWSSSDAAKVTVSGGLATRVGHGFISVSASYSGLSDSSDVLDPAVLNVRPTPNNLNVGESVQLNAYIDPDGSGMASENLSPVTASSAWSSNSTFAVIDPVVKGKVNTVNAGTNARITANYQGIIGSAIVNVTAAPLPDLMISVPPSLNSGSLVPGNILVFKGAVRNAGNATAGGTFNNRFEIDLNSSSFATADVTLTPHPQLTALVAGDSANVVSGSLTAVAGTHTVRLCADQPSPSVSESNEANNCANGSWTFTVSAPAVPAAPSLLRVDPASLNTCGAIRLTWTDNANNEDRFELERDSGSGFAKIVDRAANITSFTDTAIAQNTSYLYRIRACNAFGCSAYFPTPPATVTGNNRSPSANFSWAPLSPQVNQPTLFTDLSVAYGGASITQRQWTFQNGSPASVTSARSTTTTRFLNATPVQKSATLRVTDSSSRVCGPIAKNVTIKTGSDLPPWEEEPPE